MALVVLDGNKIMAWVPHPRSTVRKHLKKMWLIQTPSMVHVKAGAISVPRTADTLPHANERAVG